MALDLGDANGALAPGMAARGGVHCLLRIAAEHAQELAEALPGRYGLIAPDMEIGRPQPHGSGVAAP